MSRLDLSDIDLHLPCQVLNLDLLGYNRRDSNVGLRALEVLFLNSAQFLRKSFPGLTTVNMTLEAPKKLYQMNTDEIINLLTNHSTTLTSVDIGIWGGRFFQDDLTLCLAHPKPVIASGCRFEKLQRLQVEGASRGSTTNTGTNHWMQWACQIQHSEEAYFVFDLHQPLCKSILQNNEATLTKLEIHFCREWPFSLVDCSTF